MIQVIEDTEAIYREVFLDGYVLDSSKVMCSVTCDRASGSKYEVTCALLAGKTPVVTWTRCTDRLDRARLLARVAVLRPHTSRRMTWAALKKSFHSM